MIAKGTMRMMAAKNVTRGGSMNSTLATARNRTNRTRMIAQATVLRTR